MAFFALMGGCGWNNPKEMSGTVHASLELPLDSQKVGFAFSTASF